MDSGEECIVKNDHAERFPPKNDHIVTIANECQGLHHNCRSGSCNGVSQFDDTQSKVNPVWLLLVEMTIIMIMRVVLSNGISRKGT